MMQKFPDIFHTECKSSGNGKLDDLLSVTNAYIIGIDLSNSIERAYKLNSNYNAFFIQGDIAFPPFDFNSFDLIHCSGVLICTKNTELSFSILNEYVKPSGKLSVWLYHPRKDFIHNTFNFLRNYTCKLPITFQYYLYLCTIFPLSYLIKRLKGNKQTRNEMMIAIMDWFSPEYRWEIKHDVAKSWFRNRNYNEPTITTNEHFGFNIIGNKN
jgi:ubiquinone/menaquinone biosynthesis C-methylase UbiE